MCTLKKKVTGSKANQSEIAVTLASVPESEGSSCFVRPFIQPARMAAISRLDDFKRMKDEWSERDERHGRQSDEGRSERARAANEFQL